MISIHAISTGKIQDLPYSSKRPMRSALDKTKISQTTWLSSTGFTGDEQAYKDHGGPHKAVCGFSKRNYALYQDDLPTLPIHAMFGENLTFDYLDESDVYFGNQYRLGEALIEVSEIREPCWKIQAKYNIPDLVKRMSTSGKTGFYFRVLKQGYVSPNDQLYLIQEAPIEHRLSVQQLNELYYNDRQNQDMLRYALNNPFLSPTRRDKLQKMYNRTLK
ncbi:TPA: MOSC domain-containing protein [Staphylococcus aureus]|nr:MOSC domain-containing protein [Staphylococcus aureus]